MKLYLVRHGQAVPENVDPQQPLSESGQSDVLRVAAFLAHAGIQVSAVLHSGKSRARQTAECLASSVTLEGVSMEMPGLNPLDAVDGALRAIIGREADTMLVSHVPFLNNLVARLIGRDAKISGLTIHTATVICLERSEERGWTITWMIRPDLL